ncbi:MAG: hypothetical protein ABL927_13975 [Bdellovibrionales bacterium]
MKKLIILSLIMFSWSAFAAHAVRGYVTKNGTFVAPYIRTNPNITKNDNFSAKGNFNPYSNKKGSK